MADQTGGVLFDVATSNGSGIARMSADVNSEPWRFETIGGLHNVSQAIDGTIYAIENVTTDAMNSDGSHKVDSQLLLLSGTTGAVLKRISIPREVVAFQAQLDGYQMCASTRSEYQPQILGPVTQWDGSAHLLVRGYSRTMYGQCSDDGVTPREIDRSVALWHVRPDGTVTTTNLLAQHCSLGVELSTCDLAPSLQQVVPDAVGGSFAVWVYTPLGLPWVETPETRLSRVNSEDTVISDRLVATNATIGIVGDEGTVYDGLSAIDVQSWTAKWSFTGSPMVALHNGGLMTHDGGLLRVYKGDGTLESSTPIAADSVSSSPKQGEWLAVDQDFSFEGKPIRALSGPIPVQTKYSSGQITSRPLGVSRGCGDPPLLADNPDQTQRMKGVAPNHDYKFKFDKSTHSLWATNDDDEPNVSVRTAFSLWTTANQETGGALQPTDISFSRIESGNEEVSLKHRDDVDLGTRNGKPILGLTQATVNPATGLPTSKIVITWDRKVKLATAYEKVGLHEVGHVLGLDHIDPYFANPSVMHNFDGVDDYRGFVSEVVTVCDRDQAREAVRRPWVPLP
jgi:hypothetical protein